MLLESVKLRLEGVICTMDVIEFRIEFLPFIVDDTELFLAVAAFTEGKLCVYDHECFGDGSSFDDISAELISSYP